MWYKTALTTLVLLIVWGANFAFAQEGQVKSPENEPKIILTWSARSQNSPGYTGKDLGTSNSEFKVFFELISNNALADLSNHEIRWFANNHLIGSGLGLKEIDINFGPLSTSADISVEVRNFNGENLKKYAAISPQDPQLVISGPTTVSYGKNINLKALYYFLPLEEGPFVEISWLINNVLEATSIAGDIVSIDSRQGSRGDTITVSASTKNLKANSNTSVRKFIKIQ